MSSVSGFMEILCTVYKPVIISDPHYFDPNPSGKFLPLI